MMARFIVIFSTVCLQCLLFAISSGQELVTEPTNKEVIIGSNVTLNCGATNLNSTHVVAWFRGLTPIANNGTILDSSTGSYSVDITENNGVVTHRLLIHNIGPENDGKFFLCQIFNGPGIAGQPLVTSSPAAQISVHYLPSEEYPICEPSTSYDLTPGTDVTILCTSEPGSPAIDLAWTTPTGVALDSSRTVLPNGNFQQQHAFEATKEDNGKTFVCMSGSFGLIMYRKTCMAGPINVLYPPDDISVTQTTHNGLTAFRCTANANPIPSFNWTFNEPISNPLYDILENGQLLVLRNAIPCNMVDINATCTSSNSEGDRARDTTLCKVPTCTPPDQMFNLTENGNLRLLCQIDVPVDSMAWTRVYLPNDGTEELATIQSVSMLDHDFTVNRTYTNTLYQCRATNNVPPWIGTCNSGPLANVYFPPNDIGITLTTYNQQSAFRCSATGYPDDISYKWTINPAIDNALYSFIDNGQMLVLNDVIMCSEMNIIATCEASNAIGNHTADKILCQVPTCTPPDIEFDKREGDQVSFSCNIDGQIDSLNWTRIDLTSNSTDSLTMTKTQKMLAYDLEVSREHSQTLYVCSAFSETPPWIGLCESGPLVNVLFPPNDIAISQTTHDTFTAFRCSATAYPTATFDWTFNTAIISSKYDIMENDQLLVIMDMILCDSTDIVATCTVENSVDTLIDSITLCKVPTCTPPSSFEHTEGETSTLICETDDLVENISWTRTSASNISQEVKNNVNSPSLTYMWEVNRDHMETSYECLIANTAPPWAGMCQSGPFNVLYPPNDVAIISEVIELDGAQLESYLCAATGNPSNIDYGWNLAPSLDPMSYNVTDNNQRLTIKSNIVCDTDIMATCSASNDLATYKANIALCNAPICTPSTLWAITEGSNETFVCQHDVSPVDIAWNQNGSLITATNVTELAYDFIAVRNNTYATFTCTVTQNTQPSYEGFCTFGPVVVQYPPENIAVQFREYTYRNASFPSVICSATGEPKITYVWEFNNMDLIEGSHYLIIDGSGELVLLDMELCQEDIMATCVARNAVGKETITTMVCKATPSTGKPYTTDEKGAADKSSEFELTPLWIIIIALCVFMLLVIIIALLMFAIRYSPLRSVEVENRKPPEDPHARPIKLSLAPSEHSTQDIRNLNELQNAKLSLTSSPFTSPFSDLEDDDSLVPIAELQEDEPKQAQLMGIHNPTYSSFKVNSDAETAAETKKPDTVAETKKPDLLDYMTRPGSMDVDITKGNMNAEESKVANGFAGDLDKNANLPEDSNLNDADKTVEETSFDETPEYVKAPPEYQDGVKADLKTPEETSGPADPEKELEVPNAISTETQAPSHETSVLPDPENRPNVPNNNQNDIQTPEETIELIDQENVPQIPSETSTESNVNENGKEDETVDSVTDSTVDEVDSWGIIETSEGL